MKAMDRIADMEPSLFEAILRGDVRFLIPEVVELAQLDEKALSDICKKKTGKRAALMRRRDKEEERRRRKKAAEEYDTNNGGSGMDAMAPLVTGIKEMPAFDPDMELRSLAFTIPTWINAISRAESKTDMHMATDAAKGQLKAGLMRMQDQINHTLEVLK